MDAEETLRLKVRLLTEGARIPEGESQGRKGGAGPVGGRYFYLPDGRSCGIPMRKGEIAKRFNSAPLDPTDNPNIWLYDNSIEFELIPRPKFYDLKTSDGIEYDKIALLHGSRTLATTVFQSCKYWSSGTECKFCTIPHSYTSGNTVLQKTPEQIVEVVLAAEREGVIDNVLLTTGTTESPDMGVENLVRTIEAIRESSKIPVAVQFEPSVDKSTIKIVSDAGANAVGMHIESADESIREEVSPGKHEHGSLDLYQRSWQHALDYFERGNVSTYIMHGLGEDLSKTLSLVDELAEVGIMTIVAPVRPSGGSQMADYVPTYVNDLEGSIELYKSVGTSLYKHGLNPESTVGGCHNCGGCTPIQEAYDWAAQT
ncbi:MAG: radical SAM protein [Candidatus Thorarchaeota archaeon]|jgi:radical SAM protein (TIGR04043 family)